MTARGRVSVTQLHVAVFCCDIGGDGGLVLDKGICYLNPGILKRCWLYNWKHHQLRHVPSSLSESRYTVNLNLEETYFLTINAN